jgi:hypothetical protein
MLGLCLAGFGFWLFSIFLVVRYLELFLGHVEEPLVWWVWLGLFVVMVYVLKSGLKSNLGILSNLFKSIH